MTEHDDVMQAVADFLELFDEPAGAPIADACALARDLDGLAAARWPCSSSEYDADFEEEDGDSDRDRRALVAARYPWCDYYAAAHSAFDAPDRVEVTIGDAVDDLADIMYELRRVERRRHERGAVDAAAYYQWSFQIHWGRHLRDLQLYLHRCITVWRDDLERGATGG